MVGGSGIRRFGGLSGGSGTGFWGRAGGCAGAGRFGWGRPLWACHKLKPPKYGRMEAEPWNLTTCLGCPERAPDGTVCGIVKPTIDACQVAAQPVTVQTW